MEIHKPKAAHSWREFLIEIGTIICGILIALGLEQAVEAVHRGHEVSEAREALRHEMRYNLDLADYGLEEDKCAAGQLAAYSDWARGGPKPPPFRALLIGYNTSTWETVKSHAVPNMPLDERLAIASFYDVLSNIQGSVLVLRNNALVLFGIHSLDRLSEADAKRVLETVTISERLTRVHTSILEQAVSEAARSGLKPRALPPDLQQAATWLCTGRGAP